MAVELILNGVEVTLDADPGARLLDALRAHGLTGVKEGCGEGECGACTILVDGEPICSCLAFCGQVAGRRVETIDAYGEQDPLVQSVVEAGGVQCGFCTPGIVVAAKGLLAHNSKPSREEIQVALSGNLCRCTGYHRILDAVENTAAGGTERGSKR